MLLVFLVVKLSYYFSLSLTSLPLLKHEILRVALYVSHFTFHASRLFSHAFEDAHYQKRNPRRRLLFVREFPTFPGAVH